MTPPGSASAPLLMLLMVTAQRVTSQEHGHPSSPGGIPQGHAEAISLGGDPFETKAERWPDLRVRKASNEQPRSTRSTLYGPGSFQRPPMTGTSDRKGSDNGNTKKGVKKSIGDKAGGDRQKQSPGKSESSKKRTRKRKEKRAKAKKKQQKRNNKVNKKTPKKGKSKMDSQNNNTAKHRGKKANSQKRNKEQSNKKAREPKEERGKKVKKKSLKKKTGKSNAKKPKDKIKVSNTKPKIRQVSDESCDSSTKVGAGEVVAVEGPGSRRAVECKHTIRTRKGNTLKMTCPRFSLSPGRCKDEKVVIKEIGKGKFKKKYCKGEIPGEDVSEAALRAVTFVHRRAKLKGKQCAVGFLCLFSASEISGKVSECGGKYKLQEGESMVVAPATFADKVSCKYTFKSPPGSTLALSCPSFNLNERGCGRERVIVREKKAKYKKKFCKTSNPAKEHGQTTSNSFTFTHKRKKLKDNDCERGFWCQVSVAKVSPTITEPPTTVKPVAETMAVATTLSMTAPINDKPTTGQFITVIPTAGQPTTAKSTVGQSITVKPTTEQPVINKPTVGQPVTDKPTFEQLVTAKPPIGQPVSNTPAITDNPAVEQPVTSSITVGQPLIVNPTIGQSVTEQPTTGLPITDKPTIGQPMTDEPSIGQPVTDKPSLNTQSSQEPTTKPNSQNTSQPTNSQVQGIITTISIPQDKSTNDQLLTVKPTAEQSTTMKLITGQPVTVIPTTGQSLTEMPILGQPVTDKATVGQPTTDKSTSSDPVTVKITIKENLTNKPAAEQLVTEESSKQVVTVNPTIMEESTTGLRTIPPNQESPSMPNPPSATSATQSTTDTQGPTSTTEPPTSVQSTVSKGTSAQLSTPKQTLTQPPASTQTNSEPPVSTQTSVQPLTPTKVSVQPSQTSKSPQPSTQSATSTKTPTQITTSTQTSTLTTTSTQTSTLTTTSTQTSTLTTTSTQTSTLTTTSTQTSTLTTTSPQTSTQPVTSSQTSPQTSTQRETSTSTTAIAFQTRIFCETCGSGPSASGARVVGGQDVAIGEYPWMALVYVSRSSGKVSICGASLIKSRWLLSAAHCFYNVGYNLVAVFLGDHDITSNTEVPTTVGSVKSIVLHPQYDPETFDNDVALIELQADVAFTPLIAPVCLAAPEDVEDATKAVVTGWGDTSFGGDLSPVLQEVELDLISNAECRDFFQQTTLTITDNMMCAYTEGKDACQGDSGGPLVRQLADGRWVQLGVVSFGVECAKVGSPGIFTRASLYVDWIINVTASDSC
ncbi:serine protease filzig-like isoform X2 [Penaeus chinensis]|uniref:serine protease filzig-like isoform X2 n=1 Tax=Penaeus chinensis TaxID=139456 RepID=UPI001FB5A498|nr:serine protease filzig-like isoform X2 [Penaeus chinensis]XP_047491057.1 serine protease filzig-like isoform X2 [Penaeus chinensis]